MNKTRVLIVDDSALIRQVLTQVLSQDPSIEVIGTAVDPVAAREKVLSLQPDVLLLDVEMPRMDGLTFLEKLMRARPMPVVMFSSLTEKGCETTMRALELGAVDFVTKPKIDVRQGTADLVHEITGKIKAAALAKLAVRRPPPAGPIALPSASGSLIKSTHKVIAIGASTGGTEALVSLLTPLPPDCPGIVIVQHMPEKFTKSFAERLDRVCKIRVKEASDGDRILPGHVLLAPGNFHMEVDRSGANYSVRVFTAERVNRFRPSVDVLFQSCARVLGRNGIGIILTGMGSDGARGLLAMRQAGAHTIAQDEATSVVFGMPKEAISLGGAKDISALDRMPALLLDRLAA